MKLILILASMKTSKIAAFGAQKTRTHSLKRRHMQNGSLFGVDDKPEIIDALKSNIREAIGEIQLHTINNMLKNWTNRVG